MDRHRIIIIDDNTNHRSMMKNILKPLNADIHEVEGGKDVYAALRELRPHLVISKIKVRDMDGSELCMMMKRGLDTMNIPLVLTGSGVSEETIRQVLDAGASAYVDKGEARGKLVKTVKDILHSPPLAGSGEKKRILVVDDSRSMRLMLKKNLGLNGFDVICAENGKMALEILAGTRPDLILSDVYMPEMNGLELCESLHGNPMFSQIPLVVMSSENDAANMAHMMRFGASAFIVKPFNMEQLLITLKNIFSYEFLILLKEKERLDSEQRLLIAGITSLVKALEARDQYTRGHSDRVSMILAGMVKTSGGSLLEQERATIAGRLHDIGKIGIRDDVLLKTGSLSEEEFNHIKEHPHIGASILQTIPSISDIIPVVYSHHERMDGKGYPEGLKGYSIPLWARMTAVADTYDALTSDRPYRKGMTHEQALSIIQDASGTQLCPSCVRLFVDWCAKDHHEKDFFFSAS